ncbi:M24 family metallopeptidase [Desulfotomaculum copahuensis]|uniref:Peptidase M24 n=1 Tax=Desulfotomaculum copahuensis TaxID=1838280 RepID=A0A1B7LAX1_9FIRM|nr:Xaa-Pro peptidase family protein [Desulfotomaculum copahuensis]OAT79494.1 hypothetical protein A6M21_15720 [Desulfotomaculum copahuensis]
MSCTVNNIGSQGDRIAALQIKMREKGFDAALIMNPRDVYYYAGTAQPGNLLIPAGGEPVLFARRALEWILEETHVQRVLEAVGFKTIAEVVKELNIGGVLGVTEDAIPASLYNKIREAFPDFVLKNISPLVLEQRMIKDSDELQAVRDAASLFAVLHRVVMCNLCPGIKEIDLSAMILGELRKNELEGFARNRRWDASLHPEGLVASGENTWKISGHAMTVTGVGLSKSLPWGASTRVIENGDLVVVDSGINRHGYHADCSRTYVVGKATKKQRDVFAAVLEIQEQVVRSIHPGMIAGEIYRIAENAACQTGYRKYFQGYGKMQGRYIGHGVGLEVDEPPTIEPDSEIIIMPGMVLAIEPKIIIPDWGAVNLEDTLIVNESGCEIITPVGRELFEVCS